MKYERGIQANIIVHRAVNHVIIAGLIDIRHVVIQYTPMIMLD